MNYETFSEILMATEPEISKEQVIGGHKIIKPAVRLTLALCFLATGETFASLHFHSRPQRPCSFRSAPTIATSGQVQWHSGFEWLCRHNTVLCKSNANEFQ